MSATPLGPYVLGERVGTSVWLAEDTRSGKPVALKLLTKQLPKDPAKRDPLVRDVRVAAALYHAFLVPIVEVAVVGDNLLLVMQVVEGERLSAVARSGPMPRVEMLNLMYQLGDAIKFLHAKNMLHGNITGDSVLITPDGEVKLGGFNLNNILQRRDVSVYQQKGNDPRSVAYMSPEQITGQVVEERSDVFAFGLIMYELATGRQTFSGEQASDIARLIVQGQPASPKALNSAIDNAVLAVLGRCLFKDPFRRYRDGKELIDDLGRAQPDAIRVAGELSKRVIAPAAPAESGARRSILFLADVANYHDLQLLNAADATRAAARMQQLLGESVFLFDGQIVDPFGPRLIAEMPSVEAALEAARKGEFDFSPEQQEGEPLPVRMLLHAGEVTTQDGVPGGAAITRAFEVVEQLPPMTLWISEEFAKEARGNTNVRFRDAGARGGMKLYTIVPPEVAVAPEPTTAELEAEDAAAEAAHLAALTAHKRRRQQLAIGAAAALLLLAAITFLWWRQPDPSAPVVAVTGTTPSGPREMFIEPLSVETTDTSAAETAAAIHAGTIELLKTYPELRVATAADADTLRVKGALRAGTAGPELVVSAGNATSPPAAVTDVAAGVDALVRFVAGQAKAATRPPVNAAAMNAYASALTATDPSKKEERLRAAVAADPHFMPAQLTAFALYRSKGKRSEALAAAKQILALDPAHVDAARTVAQASLAAGDLASSFAAYDAVLKREPKDIDALNVIARYAAAAGDTRLFQAALARLRSMPAELVTAHAPDLLVMSGRIGSAVDGYYALENASPRNSSLALKIGRIAVLRRTTGLAEEELRKLEQTDPAYGHHILKGYMAAEARNHAEVEREIKAAFAASVPGDDYWTSVAEIYAIEGRDSKHVTAALERAAARHEPTGPYVLSNRLFSYLASDARFQKLTEALKSEQATLQQALANVSL